MRRVLVSGAIVAFMVGMLIFFRPADARAGQEVIFVVGQNQYTVDGQLYTADVAPFISDGRTYLALRYVAYALGVAEGDIKWDPDTSKVSLRLGDTTLELQVGSTTLLVNGQPRQMDVLPIIEKGRIFLPFRFVAEAFGYDVYWDAQKWAVVMRPQLTLPFIEDFSSYGLGQKAPFGPWRLAGETDPGHIEQQVQSDNKIGNVFRTSGPGHSLNIYLPASWKDYAIEVDYKGGEPSVYFRLSGDGKRGYYVTKGLGYKSRVRLHKFTPGSDQVIAESSGYDTPGDVWHRWRIEVRGANIQVFINNVKLIDIVDEDPSLSSGGVGLGHFDIDANFDNVRIKPLSSGPHRAIDVP